MAAGQQKKRLSSSSLHEHYRGKKKKKLDSSDYVLNLRSQIHLEWDDSQKRAVAKREQIGITWIDMVPFVDSVPQFRSGLADVLSVPQEIFGLDNLMEVLSYEVWATCLSESERKLLTQFLPGGTGAEQAVQSLLSGENHHFGNLFLKWSSSLCSGNLHPDDVLRMERQVRANKKHYYSELNKYHTDMLEVLQKWKERWASCKDPEKLWSKGLTKHKQGSLMTSAEKGKDAPASKKEMQHKICIRNDDVAKYMSYIKITKKQHELVKNLKQSGDGIQSKSLNRVLGDIKNFLVHPYEAFEDEEKNRLQQYWSQVVNKDLPVVLEERNDNKLRRELWRQCLIQGLAEKKTVINDKTKEIMNSESFSQEHIEDGESARLPIDMIDQEGFPSTPTTSYDHRLEHVPSLNSHQDLIPNSLDQEAAGQDVLTATDDSPLIPQFFGKSNLSEGVVDPNDSISPAKDMWQPVRNSKYQIDSETYGVTSSSELSLRLPQPGKEHRAPMIDLERDINEAEESAASLFCSYASQNRRDLLPPFPNGPGMLPSYSHELIHDSKQPRLQFLMPNENLSDPTQFSRQFPEQQLIEQRQARERALYMDQMMSKNVYPDGRYPSQGRYSSVDQRGLATLQSSINGGLVGPNWTHIGWSGVESLSSGGQGMGDGSNADGSLFSVLSECRKLPSRLPYETLSSERLVQARNNFVGGTIPNANNNSSYPFVPHQLKSSSSHGLDSASPSALNVSWMNYPHQNSSLQDSIGKPFLRSWNQ